MRRVRGQFIARLTLRADLCHRAGERDEGSLTAELRRNAIFCIVILTYCDARYTMNKSLNYARLN